VVDAVNTNRVQMPVNVEGRKKGMSHYFRSYQNEEMEGIQHETSSYNIRVRGLPG
jgi:hypothetical protein